MSIVRTGNAGFDRAAASAEAARQQAVRAAAGNQALVTAAEVVFYVTMVSLGQQFGVLTLAESAALLILLNQPPPLQN